MISVKDLCEKASPDNAVHLAYTVFAMIQTARLALENDNSGIPDPMRLSSIAIVLEVAESFAGEMNDGAEHLEREAKRGIWATKGEAA